MGRQFFYQVREPNYQLLASAAIPLYNPLDKQVSGSETKSSALGTAGLPSISGVQVTITTVNLQLFLLKEHGVRGIPIVEFAAHPVALEP